MQRAETKRSIRGGATRQSPAAPLRVSPVRQVTNWLLLVACSIGVVAVIWYWPTLSYRPINEVGIKGEMEHVSRKAVESVIEPFLGHGLVDIPLEQVRENLERLPWIDTAVVRRDWPDGLLIEVKEQQPVARWGKHELLNHRGQSFRPESLEGFEPWPKLDGPEKNQAAVMQAYLDFNQLLRKRGLQLESLQQDARGSWRAVLTGGVELDFGKDDVLARIQRFFEIYDRQLHKHVARVARIDLRYPHGLAVAWQDDDIKDGDKEMRTVSMGQQGNVDG
ncbi:MAG: cell division protein FtsQ/DivIB [Pseudomonadales bacterium]